MGKKTRKTRWRTLSIGDNPSDSESTTGDVPPKHAPKQWGSATKYHSNNSTPVRTRDSFTKWSTSRSNSSTSENKITFNEDEYTRITTPRQDVLFKKGYLSKPKPHAGNRKSLTSAGNSTGDGTPDHQSADGADYEHEPEVEYFPPEIYPTPLYYLNYETHHPQAPQPLVLYDPYGNTTFFYPPNYSHPQLGGGSEPPTTSSTHSGEDTSSNDLGVDLDKKRNSLDSDDFDLETDEPSSTNAENENPTLTSTPKYRVDAEEFIPRSYQPPPLLPLEVFPVVVFHPPMPPFFAPPGPPIGPPEGAAPPSAVDIQSIVSKLEQAAQKQNDETIDDDADNDDKQKTEPVVVCDKIQVVENIQTSPPTVVEKAPPAPPLAAKVAKEPPTIPKHQQQQQQQQQKTDKLKYSDRLKTNARKPDRKQHTIISRNNTQPEVCPRLNRTATVVNTTTTNHATSTKQSDNDWVCVNSKKKRKQQRNGDEKQETIDTQQQQQTIDPVTIECHDDPANLVQIEENIIETIETNNRDILTVENEINDVVTVEKPVEINEPITKEKINENKVQKPKQKPQKKPKKRIIITDGTLPLQVGETPPAAAVVTPPPAPPVLVVVPTVPEPQSQPESSKEEDKINLSETKKKKKRNKAKATAPTPPSSSRPVVGPSTGVAVEEEEDISSELERMISRGLYSSLEQRLQTHNPTDSFLSTLAGAPPPARPAPHVVLAPLAAAPTPDALDNQAPQPSSLRITQAVRDWMEMTRERTPEVEIFRKPEELRQEVLERVLDVDSELEDLEQGEDVLLDRSRSASLSWDYEHSSPSHSPPIEAAVDVLEDAALGPYNSLYGTAGDFQRIQTEVSAAGLRNNTRQGGPRDGGLPYRAICCSIM